MSELITDQVIAAIGAALIAGVVTLLRLHIKHRREDEKERKEQRLKDERERAAERAKRQKEAELMRQAFEKIVSIDRSVNNRQEPITKQLDRMESQQNALVEKQVKHSRDIDGIRRDINLLHTEIGTLHQTDRRIVKSLVHDREERDEVRRVIDSLTGGLRNEDHS